MFYEKHKLKIVKHSFIIGPWNVSFLHILKKASHCWFLLWRHKFDNVVCYKNFQNFFYENLNNGTIDFKKKYIFRNSILKEFHSKKWP